LKNTKDKKPKKTDFPIDEPDIELVKNTKTKNPKHKMVGVLVVANMNYSNVLTVFVITFAAFIIAGLAVVPVIELANAKSDI
jgi:hypothetical protein